VNSPIQLLLLMLVSWIGLIGLARLGKPLASRLVLLSLMGLAITAILKPELTTQVAHFLGVGRGADLLMYLGGLSFCYFLLLFHLRAKKLEQQLRVLARELAISSAHQHKDTSQPN